MLVWNAIASIHRIRQAITNSLGLHDGSFTIIRNRVGQTDPKVIAKRVIARVSQVDRR